MSIRVILTKMRGYIKHDEHGNREMASRRTMLYILDKGGNTTKEGDASNGSSAVPIFFIHFLPAAQQIPGSDASSVQA